MDELRRVEIDRNYDFFQRNLSRYMQEHKGKFALLKNADLIGFFPGPGEAYRAGLDRFSDEIFSIQEVDDRPAEMGMMSLALD